MARALTLTEIPLSEHEEACDLTQRVLRNIVQYPELACLYAIPNGGWRVDTVAKRMIAEGARTGVLDYTLPYARGGYNGLYIELKVKKGGTVSDMQKAWIRWLKCQCYCTEVCKGSQDAWDLLMHYIKQPATDGVPELTYKEKLQHAIELLPKWAALERTLLQNRLKEVS